MQSRIDKEGPTHNPRLGQSNADILAVLSALSYRTQNINQYLQAVAQGFSQLIGVDWSVVTLCQAGQEQILASTLEMGDQTQNSSFHGTLTGTVVETGRSLIVENALTTTAYGKPPAGYCAYLGVPIRVPEQGVIGTICSFHHQPRQFTPQEVKLAEVFAERAATAIDNYQLYQQLQTSNQQLQAEIQERRDVEQALRHSEEKLRQLAENMHQVFWMFSDNGTPIYISPAFASIWQQPCEAWYRQPSIWQDAIHPEDRERVSAVFEHSIEFQEEYRIIRPDGSVRIIYDQSFPIRDETGQIYRIAGIAEDITERKQSQLEMFKAMASLAEVGELAAMIVHEIRNPLSTVLMGLNFFNRLDLPEAARKRLTFALEEAHRIRNLLNEILLYSKPQALRFEVVELNEFLSMLLAIIRTMPLPMKRLLRFIPAPSPVYARVDKDKLKQVFTNIVDNACEAIPEGETITWYLDLDADHRDVYIGIHNNGNPIPEELLPKLIRPFYTTKKSGTGLGLAIVKRIVDAHGGQLQITSAAAEGTTVTVKLPQIKATPPSQA